MVKSDHLRKPRSWYPGASPVTFHLLLWRLRFIKDTSGQSFAEGSASCPSETCVGHRTLHSICSLTSEQDPSPQCQQACGACNGEAFGQQLQQHK